MTENGLRQGDEWWATSVGNIARQALQAAAAAVGAGNRGFAAAQPAGQVLHHG